MAEYTWRQWEAEQNDANLLHAADCERWQAGIELAGGTWDGSWTDLDTSGKGLITIDQFNALESQIQSKVSGYTPKNYDPDSTVQIVPGPDGWNKVEDGILKAVCEPDGVNRNFMAASADISCVRSNTANGYITEINPWCRLTDYGFSLLETESVFTLSFDYEINNITTATNVALQIRTGSSTYSSNTFGVIGVEVGDNSGHHTYSRTLTSAMITYGDRFLLSGFTAGANGGAEIRLFNIKFEKADAETRWVPAPEDYGYESETLSASPQSVEDSDEVAAPEAEK